MPDLSPYSDRQQQQAWQRAEIVNKFRELRRTAPGLLKDALPRFLAEARGQHPDLKFDRRTLYNWDKLYRDPRDIDKLIDRRGGDRCSQGDKRGRDHFRDLFLRASQPLARECWRLTDRWCKANGVKWCSYSSLKRQLDTRVDPQTQAMFRSPGTYRTKFAPYIDQAPDRHAANECWVGDHTQLDLWCWYGGRLIRPFATAFQDWRTRKLVGWALSETPDSGTIRAALRHGLMDEANTGGPDAVWIDNGKDFDAWVLHGQTEKQRRQRVLSAGYLDEPEFRGVFGFFDIEAHFSLPFNPNGKSRMERWYSTLHMQFDKSFATYCGRNPQEKPENLNRLLEQQPELIPAFEQVRDRFAQFVAGFNAGTDHAVEDLLENGRRLSPAEAMARWCQRRKVWDPGGLDYLLAHWHRPLHVGRNGITLRMGGVKLRYGQFSQLLRPFKAVRQEKRRSVYVAYDPHDLRQIRVFDEKLRYISTESENRHIDSERELYLREAIERLRARGVKTQLMQFGDGLLLELGLRLLSRAYSISDLCRWLNEQIDGSQGRQAISSTTARRFIDHLRETYQTTRREYAGFSAEARQRRREDKRRRFEQSVVEIEHTLLTAQHHRLANAVAERLDLSDIDIKLDLPRMAVLCRLLADPAGPGHMPRAWLQSQLGRRIHNRTFTTIAKRFQELWDAMEAAQARERRSKEDDEPRGG